MTACISCMPVLSYVMDQREHYLRQQLTVCEHDSSEHAALLTELAGLSLAQGRQDEANSMLQKAYQIRMKEFISGGGVCLGAADASVQQHQDETSHDANASLNAANAAINAAPANNAAPAGPESSIQQPELSPCAALQDDHSPCAESSPYSIQAGSHPPDGSAEADDRGWDYSDDWEPDLTVLRTASSFERIREQNQNRNDIAEAAAAAAAGGGSWRCASASTCRSSTPGKPSDEGSWRKPVPRGRGASKCDAGSDSESEWDTQLPVPNQPHIVEIYGLNRAVKTSHIEEFLLDFMWGGTMATVKWVDDDHALAVFPCAEAAQALLDSTQSKHKVRPYSKASNAALQIAGEDLLPPRSARPKTTTAVARRLISSALCNREVRDKAAEKELAEMRKANKQGRQQRQQQLDATWGDED